MQQAIRSLEESAPPRGGDGLFIRPVRPGDAPRLLEFLSGLSLRSVQQRFWSGGPSLMRLSRSLSAIAPNRSALVACDRSGAIVAHAEYVLLRPEAAEVAVVVADRLQGRGLGTRLVERLTHVAAEAGVIRFVANVQPDNAGMLRLFTHRFGASVRWGAEESKVAFELAPAALRGAPPALRNAA